MHAIAHAGVRTHVREPALGEKSLAAPGNRTCVGSVPVRRSNQLSYTPTPGPFQRKRRFVVSTVALCSVFTYLRDFCVCDHEQRISDQEAPRSDAACLARSLQRVSRTRHLSETRVDGYFIPPFQTETHGAMQFVSSEWNTQMHAVYLSEAHVDVKFLSSDWNALREFRSSEWNVSWYVQSFGSDKSTQGLSVYKFRLKYTDGDM